MVGSQRVRLCRRLLNGERCLKSSRRLPTAVVFQGRITYASLRVSTSVFMILLAAGWFVRCDTIALF
jgi:hypothetical protein